MPANTGRGQRDRAKPQSARYRLAELERRLDNVCRVGEVFDADHKAGKVRVRIGTGKEGETIESDWIPWATLGASNNRKWDVPEKGEQVTMFSPSGHLSNAFVMRGGIASDKHPHEAEDPNVTKSTYRTDPKGDIDASEELNRKTGVWQFFSKEKGQSRFGVGDKTSIIFDKDHIHLRVGETSVFLKEETIQMFVKGKESSVVMTPDDITSQVKGGGFTQLRERLFAASVGAKNILAISDSRIALVMQQAKVGVSMGVNSIKTMCNQSVLALSNTMASIVGGGSGTDYTPGGISDTSPTYSGRQGRHAAGSYEATNYIPPAVQAPDKTSPKPAATTGNAPSRPKK